MYIAGCVWEEWGWPLAAWLARNWQNWCKYEVRGQKYEVRSGKGIQEPRVKSQEPRKKEKILEVRNTKLEVESKKSIQENLHVKLETRRWNFKSEILNFLVRSTQLEVKSKKKLIRKVQTYNKKQTLEF